MRVTQEREISGFRVAVTQLSARRSLRVLNRLGKVLGPALGSLASALPKDNKIENLELSALGSALKDLFANLSDSDLEYFENNLLENATLNGAPFLKTCDAVLQGHPDVLLRALLFALEVNYSNFLSVLPGLKRAG